MQALAPVLPFLLIAVFFVVTIFIHKKPIEKRSNVFPLIMVIASLVLVVDFYTNGGKPYFVGVLLLIVASYIQKHFAAKADELK